MKKSKLFIMTFILSAFIFFVPTALKSFAAGSASGEIYNLDRFDPHVSDTKPILSLSQIEIPLDEITNPIQINLRVIDANYRYSKTNLHINYDKRLSLVDDNYAVIGAAGKKLESSSENNKNGIVLKTDCSEDTGLDGILWKMYFVIPENVKVGDIYPIEIAY